MDAATKCQPIAAKDGSAVVAASRADPPSAEPPPAEVIPDAQIKTTPVQIILILLGTIPFLYFARPVLLPICLACVAAMTLKPVIRWLSCCRIPPALSAAVVLCALAGAIGIGFFQLGRPALTWMNEAPQKMTELRQRFQRFFPRAAHQPGRTRASSSTSCDSPLTLCSNAMNRSARS